MEGSDNLIDLEHEKEGLGGAVSQTLSRLASCRIRGATAYVRQEVLLLTVWSWIVIGCDCFIPRACHTR
jgi:hypothetical protein